MIDHAGSHYHYGTDYVLISWRDTPVREQRAAEVAASETSPAEALDAEVRTPEAVPVGRDAEDTKHTEVEDAEVTDDAEVTADTEVTADPERSEDTQVAEVAIMAALDGPDTTGTAMPAPASMDDNEVPPVSASAILAGWGRGRSAP